MRMLSTVLYRDQPAWRDLREYLPERLRLTDATAPSEEFWEYRGHRVHLDRYANPDAPAKIVLHHGVGTNGRQMSLIVGMTFLDQRDQNVRDDTAHDKVISRIGAPSMRLLAGTPLARMPFPMTVASKMSALVNDGGALKVMTSDRTSGGNWVSIKFLDSYLNYVPAVEPADFDACPVLLTQPAEDRWSPLELSQPVLSHITKVPVTTVMLTNAGHYPVEEPGLTQMQDAIADFATVTTQ